MGMYAYDELLSHWSNERITTEQAIGHMLQHMGTLYERLRVLERRVGNMTTTTATPAPQTSKPEERKER